MGRSQRGLREAARASKDNQGDEHFPGVGVASAGAGINPALQAGSATAYEYDWSNTWPSGKDIPPP
jgi:hypothetical protein